MQELKSMQEKFNISDQDLYILSKLSSDLKSSSVFEKENINAKIKLIIGKYKINLDDNMTIVNLLKKSNVNLRTEYDEKYEDLENSEELQVVGKDGQKKFIFIVAIITIFIVAYPLSNNINSNNNNKYKNNNSKNTNDETERITFEQATQYMENRLSDANRTLMHSKMVLSGGTKVYMFMSVAKDGSTCIEGVSEVKLSVLLTDCSFTDTMIQKWNNL